MFSVELGKYTMLPSACLESGFFNLMAAFNDGRWIFSLKESVLSAKNVSCGEVPKASSTTGGWI